MTEGQNEIKICETITQNLLFVKWLFSVRLNRRAKKYQSDRMRFAKNSSTVLCLKERKKVLIHVQFSLLFLMDKDVRK
jgi:hypothetical protein